MKHLAQGYNSSVPIWDVNLRPSGNKSGSLTWVTQHALSLSLSLSPSPLPLSSGHPIMIRPGGDRALMLRGHPRSTVLTPRNRWEGSAGSRAPPRLPLSPLWRPKVISERSHGGRKSLRSTGRKTNSSAKEKRKKKSS